MGGVLPDGGTASSPPRQDAQTVVRGVAGPANNNIQAPLHERCHDIHSHLGSDFAEDSCFFYADMHGRSYFGKKIFVVIFTLFPKSGKIP